MNLDYWARRLSGRATCLLAPGAKLSPKARIRNTCGNTKAISIGANSFVAGELLTFPQGGEIRIGSWCFVGEGARLWSVARICIGDRVLISHNVNVFDSLTHPIDAKLRHAQFQAIMLRNRRPTSDLGERPIDIADDVWIGANSCILRGVSIGAGSIVGACSVVTRDVPPNCIVAGNPAKFVKSVRQDKEHD
jgi:acetyltransferase-like isoleucine patch superfamily enzyme